MDVKAYARYIRMSPRKLRLVADLIRDKNVSQAKTILEFTRRAGARPLAKLLNSAVANAKHNFKLEANNLYVKKITVDGGPVLKRWRARAYGRAGMIRKRSSHITIVLDTR